MTAPPAASTAASSGHTFLWLFEPAPAKPNDRRTSPSTASRVSYCRVDAAGVRAEWVETTLAIEGQATLVYFVDRTYEADTLQAIRPHAGRLSVVTGARVLTVACGEGPASVLSAVDRGITAYAWLLGEGCDLALTAFATDSDNRSLLRGLRVTASSRGLPLPATDVPVALGPKDLDLALEGSRARRFRLGRIRRDPGSQ